MRPVTRIFFWLNPGQEPFARAIAAAAGAEIVAAGSPERGKSASVAAELGVLATDDLRTALISADCHAVILLAPGEFGSDSGGADVRALLQARSRGVRVACLEAAPSSAIDLLSCGWDAIEDPLEPDDLIVPISLAWKPPPQLTDLLKEFGTARALQLSTGGPAQRGTLISRLLFAFALVSEFIAEVESVDASFIDSVGNPSLHLLPQEKLTELHGSFNCLLRFSGSRSATLLVSDQQQTSFFDLSMIGTQGSLRLSCTQDAIDCVWIHADNTREETHIKVDAIPFELSLVLEALEPKIETTVSMESMLTFAQTALLSARTGEAESTSTISRILESARGG